MSSNIMLSGADVDYPRRNICLVAFVTLDPLRKSRATHSLILSACSEAGLEPLQLQKTPLICPSSNFSILLSSPSAKNISLFPRPKSNLQLSSSRPHKRGGS
jgi:hypothetical protein